MANSEVSKYVNAVSEFGFKFLERALIVGALRFSAKELHSRPLEMVSWGALLLLVFWTSDALWTAHDALYETDKHRKGSPSWWWLLALTNVSTTLALIIIMGWIDQVISGLVR